MNIPLITALSFALLLAVTVLCREIQFRRALQTLVQRLLTFWRTNTHEASSDDPRDPPA